MTVSIGAFTDLNMDMASATRDYQIDDTLLHHQTAIDTINTTLLSQISNLTSQQSDIAEIKSTLRQLSTILTEISSKLSSYQPSPPSKSAVAALLQTQPESLIQPPPPTHFAYSLSKIENPTNINYDIDISGTSISSKTSLSNNIVTFISALNADRHPLPFSPSSPTSTDLHLSSASPTPPYIATTGYITPPFPLNPTSHDSAPPALTPTQFETTKSNQIPTFNPCDSCDIFDKPNLKSMASPPLLLPRLSSILPPFAHSIMTMFKFYRDYKVFNSYLTKTQIFDEINFRNTITVLALLNSTMFALVAKHTLTGIKNALLLLDYYDPTKLHDLPRGTTLTTTLYQTIGNAPGNSGFVNITNLRGGKVAIGPSAPNSKLMSDYTKSVKQLPYNISVIEVSNPITFPGLLDAPSVATAIITTLLEKAGCQTFANLVQTSGVLKSFETAEVKGFTRFAPNDEAFKKKEIPDLSFLNRLELVTLLCCVVPGYILDEWTTIDFDVVVWACLEYLETAQWMENDIKLGYEYLYAEMSCLMRTSFYASLQLILSPTIENPTNYIFPSLHKLIYPQAKQFVEPQSNDLTPFAMIIYIPNKLGRESKILIFDPGGTIDIVSIFDLEDKVVFEGMVMI